MKKGTKLILGIGFLVGGMFLIKKLTKSEDSEVDVQLVDYQTGETEEERLQRLKNQKRLYNSLKALQEGRINVEFSEADTKNLKDSIFSFDYSLNDQIKKNLAETYQQN